METDMPCNIKYIPMDQGSPPEETRSAKEVSKGEDKGKDPSQ